MKPLTIITIMQEIQLTQGLTLTQSIVKKNNQKTKLSPEKRLCSGH